MAPEHGGRVRAAARRYGIPASAWLDLSTGINPDAWRVPPLPQDLWQSLPETDDDLEDAARSFYGTNFLLPVAGSQAAIQSLPALRKTGSVMLAGLCYAEHELAWTRYGHSVIHVSDEELLQGDADVVVVVNPNNPTGKLYGVDELLDLHGRLVRKGGLLIVDEAFMDSTPEHSLARFCPMEGLVVLRSLGKFFGLAGARVGFVLASDNNLERVSERLGPWPIATPSRHVATLALCDTAWHGTARRFLREASQRLDDLLSRHGLSPSGGSRFFQWVRCENAGDLHGHFATQGILTRLYGEPASLRFGLPSLEENWSRLDAALCGMKR